MEYVYIFDVDDTLIATTACIRAIDEKGEVVFKAGTKVFNAPNSTERLLRPGLSWDFSEFESLEQIMSEPTKPAFDYLKSLPAHSKIYIITARQKQDMLHKWLLENNVCIGADHIYCFDRNFDGTVAQWKGKIVDSIITKHPCHSMMIFEDDHNNCAEMIGRCGIRGVPFKLIPV